MQNVKHKLSAASINLADIELLNFTYLNLELLESIRRWRNNPNIRKWMFNDREISREEHFKFIESLKNTDNKFYYLVKKSNTYIGVVSLTHIDYNNRNAYFGMYVNPENKVPKAGTLLGRAILTLAFTIANLHTLKLKVLENNIRAIKLYKKLGFEKEGILKEFIFRDNKWLDVIIMGMTEDEYRNKYGDLK
jgi:UDP-4-amino-4,6-dideoxy-N-acetyl-beta-L-altrosamine N-acetyltransferase